MVATLGYLGAYMNILVVVDIGGYESDCSTNCLVTRVGILRFIAFMLWVQDKHWFNEKSVDHSIVVHEFQLRFSIFDILNNEIQFAILFEIDWGYESGVFGHIKRLLNLIIIIESPICKVKENSVSFWICR